MLTSKGFRRAAMSCPIWPAPYIPTVYVVRPYPCRKDELEVRGLAQHVFGHVDRPEGRGDEHVRVPQVLAQFVPLPLCGGDELVSVYFQGLPQTQGVFCATEHFRVLGGGTARVEDGDHLHTSSLWLVME